MLNPPVLFSLCIALCGVPLAAGLGHPSVPTTWPGGLLVPRSVVLGSLQVAFARPSGLPPRRRTWYHREPLAVPLAQSSWISWWPSRALRLSPLVGFLVACVHPLGPSRRSAWYPRGPLLRLRPMALGGLSCGLRRGVGVGRPPLANKISFLGVHCDGHCCLLFHVLD